MKIILSFLLRHKAIIIIFIFGVFLRFLFFPGNIYFGFDQARDAFMSLAITKGDLQLVGPTTSLEGLNHGVAYYYLLAPIYFIAQGDPALLSAVLRILNAAGVFLVYFLVKTLFKNSEISGKIALLSAFFYAISFEQTQFALYMGNPSPAVISILIMYLGLALTIFSSKKIGLPMALLGLGLSIQFQFALIYLVVPFLFLSIIFFKSFKKISLKFYFLSALVFLFSISTFILAELKFRFRMLNTLLNFSNPGADKSPDVIISSYINAISTMTRLNLTGEVPFREILLMVLFGAYVYFLIKKKDLRKQLIFLGGWFFSLIFAFIIGGGRKSGEALFYTNVGVSISLLIFVSFLLSNLLHKYKVATFLVLGLILFANFFQIFTLNPKSTISAINVQQGMLLKTEKEILDLIYQDANNEIFAAKALTIPFQINTTWSYLYEWYGAKKYGYTPIWGDKNAQGYPGNLKVIDAQHSLPKYRYVAIEPLGGIPTHITEDYLRIEGYFTDIIWEKRIGEFKIQKRVLK